MESNRTRGFHDFSLPERQVRVPAARCRSHPVVTLALPIGSLVLRSAVRVAVGRDDARAVAVVVIALGPRLAADLASSGVVVSVWAFRHGSSPGSPLH